MNLAACIQPLRVWTHADQQNVDHLIALQSEVVPGEWSRKLAFPHPNTTLRGRGFRPVRLPRK